MRSNPNPRKRALGIDIRSTVRNNYATDPYDPPRLESGPLREYLKDEPAPADDSNKGYRRIKRRQVV